MMTFKSFLTETKAKQLAPKLLKLNKDPAKWGDENSFVNFAEKHSYDVERNRDFILAKRADRYFGFYDRYAGDGLLLNFKKHDGFASKKECLDSMIDD